MKFVAILAIVLSLNSLADSGWTPLGVCLREDSGFSGVVFNLPITFQINTRYFWRKVYMAWDIGTDCEANSMRGQFSGVSMSDPSPTIYRYGKENWFYVHDGSRRQRHLRLINADVKIYPVYGDSSSSDRKDVTVSSDEHRSNLIYVERGGFVLVLRRVED